LGFAYDSKRTVFGFVQMEQAKKSAEALDKTIALTERAIKQVEVEKEKAFQAMQEAEHQQAFFQIPWRMH
jgi:hypothetical protein